MTWAEEKVPSSEEKANTVRLGLDGLSSKVLRDGQVCQEAYG